MNPSRQILASAFATALSLGLDSAAAHTAGDIPGKEKCYGIVKAGQNDCANLSGSHSCAGQAATDRDVTEWKYVAKGTCKALKGLSEAQARAKAKAMAATSK